MQPRSYASSHLVPVNHRRDDGGNEMKQQSIVNTRIIMNQPRGRRRSNAIISKRRERFVHNEEHDVPQHEAKHKEKREKHHLSYKKKELHHE